MLVDARGCSCPQPILMTKKALKDNASIEVLVDNPTAKENVLRFAQSQGCKAVVSARPDDEYSISISR